MTIHLRPDWPRVTVDNIACECREWIHAEVPRYYLHHYPKDANLGKLSGKWVVMDRDTETADGPGYSRKGVCIRRFVVRHRQEQFEMHF